MADIISYVTIAGTSYRYKKTEPSSGETWVLNDTINVSTNFAYTINFTSNNYSCNTIQSVKDGFLRALQYKANDGQILPAYHDEDGITEWENVAYRTITFSASPTGDLLTWLQANGTKQGGATGHTLTFTGARYGDLKVNDVSVTSPYTLTEDCVITFTMLRTILTINGTDYSEQLVTDETLVVNLSNVDISVETAASGTPELPNAGYVQINYTA